MAQGVDVGFAGAAPYTLTTGFTGLRRLTFGNEETQLFWQRELSEEKGRDGKEVETPQTTLWFQPALIGLETSRQQDDRPPTR
jgi:hypothetical protein